MIKYFISLMLVFLYSQTLLASSGFYLGTQVGFLGQTNLTDISVKYLDSNTNVSGVDTVNTAFDNEISLKAQMGYQRQLTEELALIGALGYFHQSTVKNVGKRVELGAMDTSLAIQIYSGDYLRIKFGINFPLITNFDFKMDDSTKSDLQGGYLKSRGNIGADMQIAYAFREYANIFFGYNLSSVEIGEDRNDSSGSPYKVRMKHIASYFVFGVNYVVSQHRSLEW